jgi:hypothetical protein
MEDIFEIFEMRFESNNNSSKFGKPFANKGSKASNWLSFKLIEVTSPTMAGTKPTNLDRK